MNITADNSSEVGTVKFSFKTVAERDEFLKSFFPTRRGTNAPGSYTLPDGRRLQVFCENVWVGPVGRCCICGDTLVPLIENNNFAHVVVGCRSCDYGMEVEHVA
jgi:hypothetical protein